MNSQHWFDARPIIRQRRYQRSISLHPRAAIEGVIERVVDVDLLVDRVLRVLHVLYGAGIVEPRRISLAAHCRLIDEGVGPVSADDSHRDALSHISFDDSLVIAAVQIDADFLRFTQIEPPAEIGSPVSGLDANI